MAHRPYGILKFSLFMQCCRTNVKYKQYDSKGGGGVWSLVNLENIIVFAMKKENFRMLYIAYIETVDSLIS